MQNTTLELVKLNLSIAGNGWDTYLEHLIRAAKAAIAEEGIDLDGSDSDRNIIVMYASYLFRKRAEDAAPMPRMLRYALNNRLMAQKGES